ncbi:MAG: cytochrome C oxidase subunit IV family protein [Myxococcales bacterium]|nr:cytochrome C oxidase subunit IV family protein [Myxococcales bacterium]MCB9705322.1 cytochrome C oxidase subunit IV family protein [Myxococcales bacterium]
MSDKVFLNGKVVEHPHEIHHHVSPVRHYQVVLGALFVLTGLTYAVSFASLGPASLPVAMLVATIKASLVVGYFMHLKYDDRYNLFVFLGTLIFIGIFFGFTLFDLESRDALNDDQRTFTRVEEDFNNTGVKPAVGISNDPQRLAEFEAKHGGEHGAGHGAEAGAGGEAGHGGAEH